MKASEYQTMNDVDLQAELQKLLRRQFVLRMQRKTEQVQKPHLSASIRRDIARIKTVLHARSGEPVDSQS